MRSNFNEEDHLIVDTGCSDHMAREKTAFTGFETWHRRTTVANIIGALPRIADRGSLDVDITHCQDAVGSYFFYDVLSVTSCNVSLISMYSAVTRGSRFSFTTDTSIVLALMLDSYL